MWNPHGHTYQKQMQSSLVTGECLDGLPISFWNVKNFFSPVVWTEVWQTPFSCHPLWRFYLCLKVSNCPEVYSSLGSLPPKTGQGDSAKITLSCSNRTIFSTPFRVCWVICQNFCCSVDPDSMPIKETLYANLCFIACFLGKQPATATFRHYREHRTTTEKYINFLLKTSLLLKSSKVQRIWSIMTKLADITNKMNSITVFEIIE